MNENRNQQNYQGMAGGLGAQANTAGAQSETQKQLQEMRQGEHWAHEAASRSNRVGGNEGHFTMAADDEPYVTDNGEMPGGIARQFAVTDRNLDIEDEEGYPTPS